MVADTLVVTVQASVIASKILFSLGEKHPLNGYITRVPRSLGQKHKYQPGLEPWTRHS